MLKKNLWPTQPGKKKTPNLEKKKLPEEELVKKKSPRSPFKKEPPEKKLVKGKGPRSPFKGEEFEKLFETPIENQNDNNRTILSYF